MKPVAAILVKGIVTVGALAAAALFSELIYAISSVYNQRIIGFSAYYIPDILNGGRLDVSCALLVPFALALWSPGTATPYKRAIACCLGIAAGLQPVATQIITWPLIVFSPNGVWAAAVMALFATCVISFVVTKRLLRGHASTSPALPPHIRRGLIRAYVVLLIPSATWFGYVAYHSNALLKFDFAQLKEYSRAHDDDQYRSAHPDDARNTLEILAAVWDAKTYDEIPERISADVDAKGERLTNAIYAVIGTAAPPFLYPFFLWAFAGFRTSGNQAASKTRPPPAAKNQPSVMGAIVKLTYGSSPPKKRANVEQAVELSYATLLQNVIDKSEVRSIATQLYNGPMPYSTHDLATATTLNLFKSAEDTRRQKLMQMQTIARMIVLDWLKEKKVAPLLAKAFEDTLCQQYRSQI